MRLFRFRPRFTRDLVGFLLKVETEEKTSVDATCIFFLVLVLSFCRHFMHFENW